MPLGEDMRLTATFILFCVCIGVVSRAQDPCPHGSAEDTADTLIKALNADNSCSSAADRLEKCRWGSSADTEFAPIVVSKCEATFLNKLTYVGTARYEDEMQLCAYEYARQGGTLSMSEAAMCQVDVAAHFAANPDAASQPLGRASFDCGKAQTPLEKAICSDKPVGKADIVLSRVYSRVLKSFKPTEQSALNKNQHEWLQHVSTKCTVSHPPFPEKSLNCIRNEFEIRFSDLDSCQDGDEGISPCLWDPKAIADLGAAADANSSAPRATFNCESPSTALEIVICADAELGQTDIHLAQAYYEADAALGPTQHKQLVESERKWLHFVSTSCPLGTVGGIPPVLARACVRTAFETRIGQLQRCPNRAPQERIACLNGFLLFN